MATNKVPTVGYFPKSFPRDPVETNIYLEHLLLGQILKPIVEVGNDGSIQPGVADKWIVKDNGQTIEFKIASNAKFSTGKKITSTDVIYSIDRHMNSSSSQAKSYLENIKEMQIIDNQSFIIKLSRPYPAIFKALSRDQLGILPKDWKFDAQSNEPIIGSGAYRAIKQQNGKWQLIKNEHSSEFNTTEISKWNILISSGDLIADMQSEIPDFIPILLSNQIAELETKVNLSNLRKIKAVQFAQSLGWWYPNENVDISTEERRQLGMQMYREIVSSILDKHPMRSGTGVFPSGIPGYIDKTPDISRLKNLNTANRKFKFLAVGVDGALIKSSEKINSIAKKYNAEIEVIEIPIIRLKEIASIKPDMIIITYAGGFQDPEGFLTVITAFLNTDLKKVFGINLYELYIQASQELDWAKRADVYKELNKKLIMDYRVYPGWRWEGFRYCSSLLAPNNQDLSYTTKLKDIKFTS